MTEVATESGLLAANVAFYDALERADMDALGEIWTPAGAASCVHPGMDPIHGRKAVLRSWAAMLAGTPYLQFVLTDVTAEVYGTVGVVSCTENLLSATDGMPETVFAGGRAVATNVFRLEDGRWRLWVHHASPVQAPE
ncbi:MAG: nuclear transport factor 2 family protein [bacterium]